MQIIKRVTNLNKKLYWNLLNLYLFKKSFKILLKETLIFDQCVIRG